MSLSISPLQQPGQDEWSTGLAGVEDLAVLTPGALSSSEAESLSPG